MLNQVMAQREFEFRTWGGKRKGAGRKPVGERARLRHVKRPVLKKRFPVHVTWRMRKDVWKLRTPRCFGALARAFWGGCNRFGFRLVHYSVQGNHMHLLVEAADEKSLARGMNGLGVRVAQGLNKVMGRQREGARRALSRAHLADADGGAERAGVLAGANAKRHYRASRGADPYASRFALVRPQTLPDADELLRRRLAGFVGGGAREDDVAVAHVGRAGDGLGALLELGGGGGEVGVADDVAAGASDAAIDTLMIGKRRSTP